MNDMNGTGRRGERSPTPPRAAGIVRGLFCGALSFFIHLSVLLWIFGPFPYWQAWFVLLVALGAVLGLVAAVIGRVTNGLVLRLREASTENARSISGALCSSAAFTLIWLLYLASDQGVPPAVWVMDLVVGACGMYFSTLVWRPRP